MGSRDSRPRNPLVGRARGAQYGGIVGGGAKSRRKLDHWGQFAPCTSSAVTATPVAPVVTAGEAGSAAGGAEEVVRPAVRDTVPEPDGRLVLYETEPVIAEPHPEPVSEPVLPPDTSQDAQELSNQPSPPTDPVPAEGTQTEEVARSDHARYRFPPGEDQEENEALTPFDRREGEA